MLKHISDQQVLSLKHIRSLPFCIFECSYVFYEKTQARLVRDDGVEAEGVNENKAQQRPGNTEEAAGDGAPDEPSAAAGQSRQPGPVDGGLGQHGLGAAEAKQTQTRLRLKVQLGTLLMQKLQRLKQMKQGLMGRRRPS